MCIYRSTGTIRVQIKFGKSAEIFFTPNADSTVCNGDQKYAVFIEDKNKSCIIQKLGDSGVEVSIPAECKCNRPSLVAAAVQQTLVEVKVNGDWSLQSISIPAPSKKK